MRSIKSILEKYDLGFLFAFLDTSESIDYFFEHQPILPNISNWQRTLKQQNALRRELEFLELNIRKCFKYKDKLEKKQYELSNISTEFEIFKNTFSVNDMNFKSFTLLNLSQLNNLLVDLYIYFNNTTLSLYNRIRLLWKYDFLDFNSLKNNKKELELSIQKSIYVKKINKLQDEINDLEYKLINYNFENNLQNYLDKSMELFKSYLFTRYYDMVNTTFLFSNYKNNFYSFIKKYPVILSRPYAIQSNIKTNYMFDYTIFDDASQINLLESGITLACAKNAIIIGNSNKKYINVDKSISNKSSTFINKYKLSHFYDFSENSILQSIKFLYKDLPTVLFNEYKENVDNKYTSNNIKPVFSILLKDFSNSLLNNFLSHFKSNAFIDETKLAHNTIKNVLSDKNYKNFDWIFGLSIGNLINNIDNLIPAEKDFINTNYFESYFVIYRKSDNLPVLVIDVDNFTFHKDSKTFTIRDINSMKVNILAKYNIKYLSWNKEGYGDEISLINILDEIK